MAEERVCASNRKIVERMYSAFMLENDIDDTSAFNQFLYRKLQGGMSSWWSAQL